MRVIPKKVTVGMAIISCFLVHIHTQLANGSAKMQVCRNMEFQLYPLVHIADA